MKFSKLSFLFLFLIIFLNSVSAITWNRPTTIEATLNVNNSVYWDGHAFSFLASNYVPYSGASGNVDLGIYNLTADLYFGNKLISPSNNNTYIEMLYYGPKISANGINAMQFSDGIMEINNAGVDYDLRFRGSNDDALFYFDAGNDRIGIGDSSPTHKLEVNGDMNINNTLYVNTSGNVGIGTTVPTHELNVVGDLNVTGTVYTAGDQQVCTAENGLCGGTSLGAGWSNTSTSTNTSLNVGIDSGDLHVAGNGHFVSDSNSDSRIFIDLKGSNSNTGLNISADSIGSGSYFIYATGDADTERFVVRGDGKVSLGDVSPDAHLSVLANASEDILALTGPNLDLDFHFGHGVDSTDFFWRYKGTGSGNNNDLELWADNAGGSVVQVYNIKQDGTINLGVDSNKVGVGTETPTHKLTVVGDLNVTGVGYFEGNVGVGVSSPTSKFQIGTDTVSQQWSSSTPYVLIQGVDNEVATPALIVKDEDLRIMFELATTGDSSVGRAYFGGDVGIGTNKTPHELTVAGDINATGAIYANSDDQVCTAENGLCGTSSSGAGWSNDSNYVWTTQHVNISGGLNVSGATYLAGNVGVGTNAPTTKLDVVGGIEYGSDSTHRDFLEAAEYQTTTTPNNLTIHTNINFKSGHSMPYINIDGYAYGRGETIGLSVVFYLFSGNIIKYGVSSYGSYIPTNVSIFNDTDGTIGINIYDSAGIYFPSIKVSARKTRLEADSEMTGWTIDNSGVPAGISDEVIPIVEVTARRIGVNIEDPTQDLHVVGDAKITTSTYLATDSGSVGIGTTSPGEKLEVYGDATYLEVNHPSTTSYGGLKLSENGIYKGMIQIIGSAFGTVGRRGDLEIWSVNGDVVLQPSTGNVGIGTTTPTYPLEVARNVSNISIYSQTQMSATGYITRTSVFDTSKNSFDYINDASYYKDVNGDIIHDKFYGHVSYPKTDTNRPVEVENEYEVCEDILIEDVKCEECEPTYEEICHNEIEMVTTYPYTIEEEGVELGAEIDVLRQALFKVKDCTAKSKDWLEYQSCIAGV